MRNRRKLRTSPGAARRHLNRILRRRLRRTEWLYALILGLMMATCLFLAAYVNLATGLWVAVSMVVVVWFAMQVSVKRQRRTVSQAVTIPELNQAFEQMHYALDASLPESEISALYPEGCRAHCSDRIDGTWHGLPFTFANVVIDGTGVLPLFTGQWLIVRTGWPDCVRVAVRAKDDAELPDMQASNESSLMVRESAWEGLYQVSSQRGGDAAILLASEHLGALLASAEGIRLMVEQGTLHLAMPSDQPYFSLSLTAAEADEVAENTRHQIGLICAWLDRILQIEFRV